jgi:hypothetical protein
MNVFIFFYKPNPMQYYFIFFNCMYHLCTLLTKHYFYFAFVIVEKSQIVYKDNLVKWLFLSSNHCIS